MATWTTRPPQYRFDGGDLKRTIAAFEEAAWEADPNHPHWFESARHWADKCARKMGRAEFEQFMAAYAAENYTQKQLVFALMQLADELRWTRDAAKLRRAFGWPVSEAKA